MSASFDLRRSPRCVWLALRTQILIIAVEENRILVLPAGATARARLESLLVDLYGLTPAESKLASLLAEGLSLEAAGQALGIRHNTARTHLARVFDKTGTSRQAELVARILCGPAMLGLSP